MSLVRPSHSRRIAINTRDPPWIVAAGNSNARAKTSTLRSLWTNVTI